MSAPGNIQLVQILINYSIYLNHFDCTENICIQEKNVNQREKTLGMAGHRNLQSMTERVLQV